MSVRFEQNEEVLSALRTVYQEVRQVRAELTALRAEMRAGATTTAAPATQVATDDDLDGKYGDPEIRRDTKRWTGAPVAPCRMSEAPADYLDVLASFYDWQAERDEAKGTEEDRKKAGYARRDAARARGWAMRKRAQVVTTGDDL